MAKIEVISASSREEAEAAIDRINAGEAFADVAKEVSLETDVATTGGLKDFEANGAFSGAYNDYAFSAPVGQLSEPLALEGALNNYVVRVIERSEQTVREDQKPSLASDEFDEWLTSTKEELQSSGALVERFDNQARADALISVYSDASGEIAQLQQDQIDAAIQQQTVTAQFTQTTPLTPVAGTPAAEGTPVAVPTSAATASAPGDGGATAPSQPVVPGDGQ
jgi:hypothetical protein